MARNLIFFILFSYPVNAIIAAEPPTYDELQAQISALTQEILTLKGIIQGTTHPINLGRTSITSVTASSVNGDRALDNPFYGICNAFDGGENWINNINYTYWLATGAYSFVEVFFDHPVSLASILS